MEGTRQAIFCSNGNRWVQISLLSNEVIQKIGEELHSRGSAMQYLHPSCLPSLSFLLRLLTGMDS